MSTVRDPRLGLEVALVVALSACATGPAPPEKSQQERLEERRVQEATTLHGQLARCAENPSKFCDACLNYHRVFLDEDDQRLFHRICQNYVMSRRCAPGYDDPNLPADVQKAMCEESTLGDLDTAQKAVNAQTGPASAGEPPEPSPEEKERLMREFTKTIQQVDDEDAAKAKNKANRASP